MNQARSSSTAAMDAGWLDPSATPKVTAQLPAGSNAGLSDAKGPRAHDVGGGLAAAM